MNGLLSSFLLIVRKKKKETKQQKHSNKKKQKHFFYSLITVGPQITTHPQSISVTAGKNLTLYCNASGNPEPTISWTKNNTLLASGDARVIFGTNNTQLTITSVNREDSGEYRCVATNNVATATSNAATVDVQCKYLNYASLVYLYIRPVCFVIGQKLIDKRAENPSFI